MSDHRRLTLRGAALALLVTAVAGVTTSAAPALVRPSSVAAVGGAIGEGASDVLAYYSGSVKGIVHAAVLGDGSVRVRAVVRGADPARSYKIIGASTPCGQPAAGKVVLLPVQAEMGTMQTHVWAAGDLPERTGLLASVRIVRAGGAQVACGDAQSHEPVHTVAGPALKLTDVLVSSFANAGKPRGLLVINGPSSDSPQLRWSLTGLGGVSSFRIVASTAPCGTANTPATETYRSKAIARSYGFIEEAEFVDWTINVRSVRLVASGGGQLACTGRGRHVAPLF